MKTIWTLILATFGALIGNICSGCGTVQPVYESEKIVDGIERVTQTATVVCDTVQQLEAAGVEIPYADQCAAIVQQLTGLEWMTVMEVLDCTRKYEHGSDKCDQCVFEAGWPELKKHIEQLVRK